jgi:hypothetical protein
MAHCYVMDFDGGTTAQYDAVDQALEPGGHRALPPGALYHGAGLTADGLRVVDVWDDEEAFDTFIRTQVGPQGGAQGLSAPRVRAMPVAQIRRNGDDRVTFLQLVHLPGVDADGFVELDKRVLGEAREAPAGCVFHVNGPAEGGWYVMDAWTSKDIRDRFLAEHVVPAIGDRVAPPTIEELPLHATLQSAAPAPV